MRGGKEKGLAHRDLSKGWKEVRRIERQIRDDILDRAQVLCCTCIGSGHELLDGRRFSRVLIDEATQATEPATLVPLVRGARQVVMVGDHRQLPPTVISRRAEQGGLARSLFERLVDLGVSTILLDTLKQYNEVAQGRSDKLPDFSEISEIQDNDSEAELLRNVQLVVDGLNGVG